MKKLNFVPLVSLLAALTITLTACGGGGEPAALEPPEVKATAAASSAEDPALIPGSSCGAGNNCPGEVYPTGPGVVQNIGAMFSTPTGPVCTVGQPGNGSCGGKGLKTACTACPAADGVPAYTLCNWQPASPPPLQVCPYYYHQRELK